MLNDFTPRLYQETIFATAAKKNTLVVLPTGLGKTAIALMLAVHRLSLYPKSKVLFLAPTKPLAEQHFSIAQKKMNIPEIVLFTGAVSPAKRAEQWQNAKVIIGTPQGIENDVLGDKIAMQDVSLLIMDEAHHATGDYSYNFISKQYMKNAKFPRILGLTASPGANLEKIKEVCSNIFAEAIEVRTYADPDVRQYIKEIQTEWIELDLPPELREIQRILLDCYSTKMESIKRLGYAANTKMTKRELLELQSELHSMIGAGDKSIELLKSISLIAEAVKVQHAVELIETQGVQPLQSYLRKLEEEARASKSKAAKNLAADHNFKAAFIKTLAQKTLHPKIPLLVETVSRQPESKIIIFTQYRDSAVEIIKALANFKCKLFVGQAKKGATGMSQKEQKAILDDFRSGLFNVLVCTSVGEEGLDIPAVDLVLFYEPIPSAIRHIQRRGRTGRQEVGRVIVLVTKKTRDEAYRWAAHHKEKQMYRTLEKLKHAFELKQQPSLQSYAPEQKLQIIADYREKGSEVLKQLIELGISLRLEKLSSADYLCSANCGVEFKTVEDFVNSIIDGRLIEQLKELKKNFAKPLVIIQGEQDIYSVRKIHPNAIRGMLASVAVGFGIPILQTKNAIETASLLSIIAKREQDTGRDFAMHAKKPLTLAEQQEYIVSAFPGLGLKAAQMLLKHFKSIENIAKAKIDELKEVDGVGDILAKRINMVLKEEYKKD